jgi:hypothetical protein
MVRIHSREFAQQFDWPGLYTARAEAKNCMEDYIFKTRAPGAGPGDSKSTTPPPLAVHDSNCERMWELFSTFLTEQIFYVAYDTAMGHHAQNRSVSIADHYLALLAATCQRLARDRQLVGTLARTFFDYAKVSQPALEHDSEPVFLSRVVQAYAPVSYVRDMGADQIRQYTHGALVTVALRAYEVARGAEVSDRILRREGPVIDSLRGQFNQLSRAHRLELGSRLSQRGRVTVKTPYDDASEHIRQLTEQVQRLSQANAALEADRRQARKLTSTVASLTAENARMHREVGRHSKANTDLLRCAASQISARKKLAGEKRQCQDDARTLLNIQRMANNTVPAANFLPHDYEPTADDSVSVRGARPVGYLEFPTAGGADAWEFDASNSATPANRPESPEFAASGALKSETSSVHSDQSDQNSEVDMQSIMESFDSKSTQFERDLQ